MQTGFPFSLIHHHITPFFDLGICGVYRALIRYSSAPFVKETLARQSEAI
jgi:hypothetical protein